VRDDVPYRIIGVVSDFTDRRHAEREIAAHVAVEEALLEWEALAPGAGRLLARLADALDCRRGVFWVPRDDVLVPLVVWHDRGVAPPPEPATRDRPLRRGSGLAGRAWKSRKPLSWTLEGSATDPAKPPDRAAALSGAIAIPALDGDRVLAIVELGADREIRISERLMRSLVGISHELGHFLARRGGELARPLLTPREIEVLQIAAHGLSARESAARLVVSPATVRTHLENIRRKLQVSDKASAVAVALRLGLID
jgi:DNA-binding CsgD family transcriptional regulator